jgi:DNA-binding transcriptional MerR regulator
MNADVIGRVGPDPLATLRQYRGLAPWGLRDLAALAGAILQASDIMPLNAAARARPSERTIRFYVMRGLVSPPEGRGTAATYGYRHLLQVLAIKLRQMEGGALDAIIKEFAGLSGDMIERRVASALGPALPAPERLQLTYATGTEPRGKVGRALQGWLNSGEAGDIELRSTTCRRLPLAPGVELLVDQQHPLMRLHGDDRDITNAFRDTLARVLQSKEPTSD